MNDASRKIQASCSSLSEFLLPLLFIILSVVFIWKAQDMSPLGGVFPTTIAVVTFVSALLRIAFLWLRGVHSNPERDKGSVSRRVLLVVTMTVWALMMPWAGFVLTGLASFVSLMLIAQHDYWDTRRMLTYLVAGAVLVGLFYGLFALLLNVPLPVGRWWME